MTRRPTYEELEQKVKELGKLEAKRKRVEKDLLDAKQKWMSLIENTNDFIMIIDDNSRIQYINRAIPPNTVDQVTGKTLYDFSVPEHHEMIRQAVAKTFETRKQGSYTSSVKHPTGIQWFETTVVPIIKEGRVSSALLFNKIITERKQAEEALRKAHDELEIQVKNRTAELVSTNEKLKKEITEHKKSEAALQESEEKYRSLFQGATNPITILDKKGIIVMVNDAGARQLGLPQHACIGKSVFELIPDLDDSYYEVYRQVIDTGKEVAREDVVELPSGFRWFWSIHQPVSDINGKRYGVQVISYDITKRKRAEESLKIYRENLLEEHNQRKILSKKLIDLLEKDRHYIAMELHDNIGQILTSLKISLEIIDGKLKPTDTELESLIKTARRRAKQAIVDLNNIAHGLMPGILDALGLVSSLHTLLDEVKEHTDIKIVFFNRNVPKRFDQEKELAIYRIVQEALNNIIKHAEAKNVYVSLLKKGNVLFLSVEDDGVGFDQDKAMKISKGKGPLGLVIMQERAMQLDGELTIESKMGKGTHLLAEIPI